MLKRSVAADECNINECIIMAPYDARAVANFILDHQKSKSRETTQLQLLKLIYFAHGWYLAMYNRPLIRNEFEAWEYGPVIRCIRECFKEHRDKPITTRAYQLDIFTGQQSIVPPILEETDAHFIIAVCTEYSGHTGWQLSNMTHEPGSPWDLIWNSSTPVARVGLRIKDVDIRTHFASCSRRSMLF